MLFYIGAVVSLFIGMLQMHLSNSPVKKMPNINVISNL